MFDDRIDRNDERIVRDDVSMVEAQHRLGLRRNARGETVPGDDTRQRSGRRVAIAAVVVMAVVGFAVGDVVFALFLGGATAGLLGTLRWLFR